MRCVTCCATSALYGFKTTRRSRRQFELANIDVVTCRRRFRFLPDEIEQLEEALDLPPYIYTAQGCHVPRQEALCLLLRRLAYPCRLKDLEEEFGRKESVLSSAINVTVKLVYEKIKTKMAFDERIVDRYHRQSAAAIFQKVGRLSNCIGFIDGTIRPICRPTWYQEQAYSGHKKVHCIKFQSVTLANGLIVSFVGPFEGRRHDAYMLRKSEMELKMTRYPDYVLYGDQGYPLRRWLITPFASAAPTPPQLRFNRDLSRARIAVEWFFGWVVRYWKFFELRCNMKVFKSPVGSMYVIAAFFVNCLSCIRRRNQASKYFRCRLPTLEIYLADLVTNGFVDEAQYSSDEEINFFEDESELSSWDGSDDSESDTSDDGSSYGVDFESTSDDESGGADGSSDEASSTSHREIDETREANTAFVTSSDINEDA